jgi:hypothetical protein
MDGQIGYFKMSQKMTEEKFKEWTHGRSPEEKRISIFEHVRDIPFAVSSGDFSPEKGPEAMLKKNKGFCIPKHYFLGKTYVDIGLDVRYCVYPFNWYTAGTGYPGRLARMAEGLPQTYHMACEARIGNRWVLVDATWDVLLKPAGLSVNEKWNGKENTVLAVKPLGKIVLGSAEDADTLLKKKLSAYTLSQKLRLSRFSAELNRWLEGARGLGQVEVIS